MDKKRNELSGQDFDDPEHTAKKAKLEGILNGSVYFQFDYSVYFKLRFTQIMFNLEFFLEYLFNC